MYERLVTLLCVVYLLSCLPFRWSSTVFGLFSPSFTCCCFFRVVLMIAAQNPFNVRWVENKIKRGSDSIKFRMNERLLFTHLVLSFRWLSVCFLYFIHNICGSGVWGQLRYDLSFLTINTQQIIIANYHYLTMDNTFSISWLYASIFYLRRCCAEHFFVSTISRLWPIIKYYKTSNFFFENVWHFFGLLLCVSIFRYIIWFYTIFGCSTVSNEICIWLPLECESIFF